MQINEAKPPYVTFETRSVEDRGQTLETGHYVGRDVVFALVTPQGSKDKIEKIAEEWLRDLETAVRDERFPLNWLQAYKSMFKEWSEGREIPLDGTPILTWPAISISQQKNILDANIRTVEDLAAANEQTLTFIGMGARALKEKAQAWIDTANGSGKIAGELEKLRKQNEELKAKNTSNDEKMTKMAAQIEALTVNSKVAAA